MRQLIPLQFISCKSEAVCNNCQVTVAHINATAKNAADDKLRQSLRRFAETHTAPATVVLVSCEFSSDSLNCGAATMPTWFC